MSHWATSWPSTRAISGGGEDKKWVHFVAQGHGLYGLVWENNGMGLFGDLHKKISPPSTHKKIILVGYRFPSLLRAPK